MYTLLFNKCICKTEVGLGCTVHENSCKPYLKQASLCKMFQKKDLISFHVASYLFFFSFLILTLSKVKLLLISNAYIVSVKRPHFYSLLVTNYLLLFTFNFVVFYILLITCYFFFDISYFLLIKHYKLALVSLT